MKTTELRIGNFLIDEYGDTIEIDGVTRENVLFGGCFLPIERHKPIPLTTEWLERLWFKKDDNSHFWIELALGSHLELIPSEGWFYPIIAEHPELLRQIEQRVAVERIITVHQLQNLYHSLTGKELTPNPPIF